MKIQQIDKNLAVDTNINIKELNFDEVRNLEVDIYGLYKPQTKGRFRRLPSEVAHILGKETFELSENTSGGRLRFVTNSKKLVLKAYMPNKCLMSHMTFCGSSGFDLYVKENGHFLYRGSFIPPIGKKDGYISEILFENTTKRECIIHFPLYDKVEKLELGIYKGAHLHRGLPYKTNKPVVFYGSSITQGGCASRPGNSYSALLSRMLDFDFINLGFSGRALGEKEMVAYLSSLPMSCLFFDYDHNAEEPEYLQKTHSQAYRIFREKQPQTPIIFVTRTDLPTFEKIEKIAKMRKIIYKTYSSALSLGDKNVYFIDGQKVFCGINYDACTVDGVHPNDYGFVKMANYFSPVLQNVLR